MNFLKKQYALNNHKNSFALFLKKCFTIALNISNIGEESLYYFIDEQFIDINCFMKENSIINSHFPTTNSDIFVTVGDLCFIFAEKLKKYYTDPSTNVVKPFLTSSHIGDIRLIYKTLYYKLAYDTAVTEKVLNYEYLQQYRISAWLSNEFDLINELGLMNELLAYSKKIKYKFELDDEFELLDINVHGFRRNLPFLCFSTMPSNCNLKQIIAIIVSTYKKATLSYVSTQVLHQTYTLLHPVIKKIYHTLEFEHLFNEICELLNFKITVDEIIEDMDLNSCKDIGCIAVKLPTEEQISRYLAYQKYEIEKMHRDQYEFELGKELLNLPMKEFYEHPLPMKHKIMLLEKLKNTTVTAQNLLASKQ